MCGLVVVVSLWVSYLENPQETITPPPGKSLWFKALMHVVNAITLGIRFNFIF